MISANFYLKNALDDFRRNKIRTFLTSLGILIGVASVVMLMSLGLGLKAYINQQFESLGANLLYVMPGNFESGISGGFQSSMMTGIRFDNRDVVTLNRVKRLLHVVPVFQTVTKVTGENDAKIYEISAATANVFDLMSVKAQAGQLWTKTDEDKGNKKAVVGPNVAEKLFGTINAALTRKIIIENTSYTVVGVAESKGGGGGFGRSIDDQIYIPFKAATSFNPEKKYMVIMLQAKTAEDIPIVKTETKEALLKRYDKDKFSVVEQTEILTTITSIFNVLNLVLVSIAAISLLVGGIGIMNIMFVSVIERTREIGIRRALGARKNDILIQFVTESVLLSAFGGFMGLAVATVGVTLIRPIFPAYIDSATVILAVGVSSLVGIIFGVAPAKRAAELSPIEAIRYE
jgi:ABC-type antimicrobial peptide transport system permease subunit